MALQDKYDRLLQLKHQLGHTSEGEYDIILQVAHRVKLYDTDEEDALDGLLKYYEESVQLRQQELEKIKTP